MSTARARKIRAPKLGRRSNGRLMTPEEFDAVTRYDDLYSYELIRGVLVVSPYASKGERGPSDELGHLLAKYAEEHPEGSIIDETVFEEYIALPDSRRRADRVIWTGLGRAPTDADVPSIVVEFVSKRTRDRVRDHVEKSREYLELGVREYWVIDRFQRIMTVFRKPPAEPAEQVIKADGIYQTPLLPGFDLTLAKLLERADRYSDKRRSK